MNAGFSFNPMDPQLLADPYPIFQWMREEDPIHRSDLGFWVMTRHEDCRHVLIDKTFGQGDFVKNIQLFYDADFDVLAHPAYIWLSRVFVMQDPPTHTRLRGLVAGALSLKRIRAMEPRVRELARAMLARLADQPGTNFIETFAYRFPTLVMCDMLGLEEHEFSDELLTQLNLAIADTFPVFETRALCEEELALANRQMEFLTAFFDDLFERRRAHPRDDLTTALVQAREGDASLSSEELSTSVIGLFGAGFETTAHMIGNGMFLLGTHPDERAKLRADQSLAAAATEEIVRYESSLQATYRTALADTVVSGQSIAAGDRILTIVAAANRDKNVFDRPETFVIDPREEKPLTFGGGIHYCVGAELARLEGRVFLEELFTAFPDFEVDTQTARLRQAFLFRGFEHLAVRL
ncbi:MAG: cytochrome P450 [Luminiphilus sp.]|nr:cytochrome P450 [Luminiphilus sp.]